MPEAAEDEHASPLTEQNLAVQQALKRRVGWVSGIVHLDPFDARADKSVSLYSNRQPRHPGHHHEMPGIIVLGKTSAARCSRAGGAMRTGEPRSAPARYARDEPQKAQAREHRQEREQEEDDSALRVDRLAVGH